MGGGSEIPARDASIPEVTSDNDIKSTKNATPRKEFKVLVTGTGPFPDAQGGHYGEDDNTSHLVTKLLPSDLPAHSVFNSTSTPIKILNPTSGAGKYVKTEYAYIRSYIHLGMADGFEWYTVEERAFNEDFKSDWWGPLEQFAGYYLIPDDAGKTVRDITEGERKGMWKELPMGLSARLDVGMVAREAQRVVNVPTNKDDGAEKMKVAVVPHFEAGSYCCGFIYYESLATCFKRGYGTKVVFCHVPGWRDPERLEKGADVISAVIGAVCLQISRGW